jgi:hypothetical protein
MDRLSLGHLLKGVRTVKKKVPKLVSQMDSSWDPCLASAEMARMISSDNRRLVVALKELTLEYYIF